MKQDGWNPTLLIASPQQICGHRNVWKTQADSLVKVMRYLHTIPTSGIEMKTTYKHTCSVLSIFFCFSTLQWYLLLSHWGVHKKVHMHRLPACINHLAIPRLICLLGKVSYEEVSLSVYIVCVCVCVCVFVWMKNREKVKQRLKKQLLHYPWSNIK